MLYKDWQCLNYLVSLKQLKQKLHIEKKVNNDSFPSCLYFTTTIITNAFNSVLPPKGIVTPHLGPNVLTLNVLYDLLKTWWVEQWSHVKDIWFAFAALLWPFCVWSVCVPEEALGLKHVPTPSTPDSPHPTIPMARPAVFLCCVMTGLCPPGGQAPPNLYPLAPVPGSISFSLLAPSRIGSNIPLWSPVSLSSLCGLWGPSHSLALRFSLYHVLFFSLVAFYSFKFFPSFQSVVFVSLFPCFILFSVLPKLPSGTPVFPLKDAFQLSSPPLSLLMGRAGDNLLCLLIHLFGSGWG